MGTCRCAPRTAHGAACPARRHAHRRRHPRHPATSGAARPRTSPPSRPSTRSTARTGRSCAWSSGTAGSTAGGENVHPPRRGTTSWPACASALEIGDGLNLYMFHGGTNFGFMNACSARHTHDIHPGHELRLRTPPLNEEGNPTEKWYKLRDMVRELYPDAWTAEPLVKQAVAVGEIPATGRVSLFNVLDALSEPRALPVPPRPWRDLGQSYGYTLYTTTIERGRRRGTPRSASASIDGRDPREGLRGGQPAWPRSTRSISARTSSASLPARAQPPGTSLMENMGRRGATATSSWPTRSTRASARGVCADLHFHHRGGEQRCLPAHRTSPASISPPGSRRAQPAFHRFEFTLDEPADTFIDTTGFGKGCAFVNGGERRALFGRLVPS